MIWCDAWSPEKKAAELRLYRAKCLLRCLESNLDRIDPEQFDELMSQIEATRMEIFSAARENIDLAVSDKLYSQR